MIRSKDRSGWIGASDTRWVMGRWDSPAFARWWLVKLGVIRDDFSTTAMRAGTAYEHTVLDWMGITKRDRQIKKRHLRLRVNLDGERGSLITEVKTYRKDFKVKAEYWQQCQVEMYAAKKDCQIAAYRVTEEEYADYFMPIDPLRLTLIPIEYDSEWIEREYLPRLRYLAKCLRKKVTPCEARFFKVYEMREGNHRYLRQIR